MSKWLQYALILSALIMGVFFYWQGFQQTRSFEPIKLTQQMRENSATRRPQSAIPMADQRVSLPPQGTNQPLESMSEPLAQPGQTQATEELIDMCRSDWQGIAETELVRLRRDLENGRALLSEDCRNAMIERTQAESINTFLARCTGVDRRRAEDVCASELDTFRSYVVRRLFESNPSPVEDLPTSTLINQLVGGLVAPSQLSLEDVERNLRLADELIRREPDLYSAYKAKLISLLVKEIHLSEPVALAEYQEVYDELLTFNSGDQADVGMDEDLIHIPFVRQAALGDWSELMDMSEDYIEAFPGSYIGYYYLAEGLWKTGQKEEAALVLQDAMQGSNNEQMLMQLFERVQNQDASQTLLNFPIPFELQ